jgi:hypothetical protein
VAAVRLVARLEEVLAHRWMTAPMPEGPAATAALWPRVVPEQRPAQAVVADAPAASGAEPAVEPAAIVPGPPTAPLFAPEPAAIVPGPPTAPLFAPEPAAVAAEAAAVAPEPATAPPNEAPRRRSFLDRLLGRNRP